MDGFLNYLDEFNQKHKIQQATPQPKPVVKKVEEQTIVKPKVLCMNVEIRTVEGAQKVIDKLQEWISRQEQKEHFELKETPTNQTAPRLKIPPKKVIKSPVLETRSHAMDILNGLPDENILTKEMVQTNINISNQTQSYQPQQLKKETVAGHASSLL